jgi:hypothetical protein
VVAAALVAVDVVLKDRAENAIAAHVQRSTHSEGASASIHSFPFLFEAAVRGRVDRIDITDRGVPAGPVRIDQVRLDASQVHFDRGQLLNDRKVVLTSVSRATLSAQIELSGIEGAIASGLDLQVTASGSNHIAISIAGHTLTVIDLTRIPIVPDCPLTISHTGTRYTFSCTVSPVPQSVLAALSKGH